jgi:hypothetical protein
VVVENKVVSQERAMSTIFEKGKLQLATAKGGRTMATCPHSVAAMTTELRGSALQQLHFIGGTACKLKARRAVGLIAYHKARREVRGLPVSWHPHPPGVLTPHPKSTRAWVLPPPPPTCVLDPEACHMEPTVCPFRLLDC